MIVAKEMGGNKESVVCSMGIKLYLYKISVFERFGIQYSVYH
jgi:hypothetical protein